MSEERRTTMTVSLWFLSAIVLAALFIASAVQGELTSAHIAFAAVMLFLATIGTIAVWRMKDDTAQAEKRKRTGVDNLIRDLSDDELLELRHRLMQVESNIEPITTYLGDDGELKQRR